MPDKILNSKLIVGPLIYVVRDNDDILNVDTTLGIVTLVFANIRGSGFNFIQKQYYINDIGNNASVNNIVLQATGGDLINNNVSISLTQNGASVQVQISSQTEWLATGDVGGVIPPPFVLPPLANVVYVAKNGNDITGDGSIGKPFLTVQKGIDIAFTYQLLVPITRPIVIVAPGTYTENCVLKANVFVRGVGINDTRIGGNWTIDATFTPPGDWRSGFIDISILGSLTVDFNAQSSSEGKVFITNTRITGPITFTAFSSSNQFIWFGGEFLGLITLNGMNTQLNEVVDQSVNGVLINSNANSDTVFSTTGGVISNITTNVTIDAPFNLDLKHSIKRTSTLTLGNSTLNLSLPNVIANIQSVPLEAQLVYTGNANVDNLLIINPIITNFQLPPNANEKQFIQITDFNTGSLPVGWSGAVSGTGSSVVYTQVTESGNGPGMAFATITNTSAGKVSLVTGSGYQYMPSFIDGKETTYFCQMRWGSVPSVTNCVQVLGWLNTNGMLTPNAMNNTLAIMYDPANVSGFNPGLITNLFLLARSNYNGPIANTVVNLGVTPHTTWRFYKITYDNVRQQVRVYRDNILLTTLVNMANVPAGPTRGIIPTGATNGLQAGFYIGNGGVTGGTGASIRISKISVFKLFS